MSEAEAQSLTQLDLDLDLDLEFQHIGELSSLFDGFEEPPLHSPVIEDEAELQRAIRESEEESARRSALSEREREEEETLARVLKESAAVGSGDPFHSNTTGRSIASTNHPKPNPNTTNTGRSGGSGGFESTTGFETVRHDWDGLSRQMMQLGFTDDMRNKRELRAHGGDLER